VVASSFLYLGFPIHYTNYLHDDLCQKARKKVLREFDSQLVAAKYIDLYRSVLKG